jgi:RNA polymerase sigma factor (sigma-70 family)
MEGLTPRSAAAMDVRTAALKVARHRRLGHDDADDLAQEVVARFVALDEPAENPQAWATTVATNLANDWHRRDQGRQGRLGDPVAPDDPSVDMGIAAIQRHLDALVAPSLQAMNRAVAEQIAIELTPRELELMTLVADGYPHAEIAERLGYAGADSVKATAARIRRRIRERFDGDDIQELLGHPRAY